MADRTPPRYKHGGMAWQQELNHFEKAHETEARSASVLSPKPPARETLRWPEPASSDGDAPLTPSRVRLQNPPFGFRTGKQLWATARVAALSRVREHRQKASALTAADLKQIESIDSTHRRLSLLVGKAATQECRERAEAKSQAFLQRYSDADAAQRRATKSIGQSELISPRPATPTRSGAQSVKTRSRSPLTRATVATPAASTLYRPADAPTSTGEGRAKLAQQLEHQIAEPIAAITAQKDTLTERSLRDAAKVTATRLKHMGDPAWPANWQTSEVDLCRSKNAKQWEARRQLAKSNFEVRKAYGKHQRQYLSEARKAEKEAAKVSSQAAVTQEAAATPLPPDEQDYEQMEEDERDLALAVAHAESTAEMMRLLAAEHGIRPAAASSSASSTASTAQTAPTWWAAASGNAGKSSLRSSRNSTPPRQRNASPAPAAAVDADEPVDESPAERLARLAKGKRSSVDSIAFMRGWGSGKSGGEPQGPIATPPWRRNSLADERMRRDNLSAAGGRAHVKWGAADTSGTGAAAVFIPPPEQKRSRAASPTEHSQLHMRTESEIYLPPGTAPPQTPSSPVPRRRHRQ